MSLRADMLSTINEDLRTMVTIGVLSPLEHVNRIDQAKHMETRELVTTMNFTHDEACAYVWDHNTSQAV